MVESKKGLLNRSASMNISVYLDDVCETSQIIDKKIQGKTNAEINEMNYKRDRI